MKFDRVVIENFRQYFGRQQVVFSRDKDKNVTIIHGANGAGKTSFFLAVNWCLYGRSIENLRIIDNVGELVSKEAVIRSKEGDIVRSSVELSFFHEDLRYTVRRSIEAIKSDNGALTFPEEESFTIRKTGTDGRSERVGNPIGIINSILPANAREYFLFDGEKIDNFAKPEAAAQVKEAIYMVLKIRILERSRNHLDALASEYRREYRNSSGEELSGLLEKEEKVRAGIKKAKDRLLDLSVEKKKTEARIDEIEATLKDLERINVLGKQRELGERELKIYRNELSSLISKSRELVSSGFVVSATPAITRAVEILESRKANGEISGNYNRSFIKDLLEKKICVCGRPFELGGDEYSILEAKLEKCLPESIQNESLDALTSFHILLDGIKRKRDEAFSLVSKRDELADSVKRLEAETDDLNRQLKDSPLGKIGSLEHNREKLFSDVHSMILETGGLNERLESLSENLGDISKTIEKTRSQEKKNLLLGTKLDLAQKAADAIGEMYQTFADDMREKIQNKTRDIFSRLIWKDSHFKDIRLGPDFNLEVIDRYGTSVRPELSAGERQVLSLSFIMAMSMISEEETPLVMDTPFGRLSSHHRNSITGHLPQIAHQLVLFVTGEELRGEARRNLEDRIGAEYLLDFASETSCTRIKGVN